MLTLVAVAGAAAAAAYGPPAPVLHSRGEGLTAARGSYCWVTPGRGVCAETTPPPVTARSLPVRSRGRVRIDMRIETDRLFVSLRGRRGRLRLHRANGSQRRFVARLPRHVEDGAVLDLSARYPQGSGAFGARLRTP
jgi:hypothetical protein